MNIYYFACTRVVFNNCVLFFQQVNHVDQVDPKFFISRVELEANWTFKYELAELALVKMLMTVMNMDRFLYTKVSLQNAG